MPKTRSAKKMLRVAERRQRYNRPVRSAVKTFVSRAEKLIATGDTSSAQEAVVKAVRALDKAAQKGVLHRNNAARRKSRLMKKLNTTLASASS